ncbi:MAG: ABC transporter ATP-binding protein [Burkholderiaceae bacterium]|jgi:NitT/TauT family transport system ATP-binding protein|nr:ABC transporter ATP-binding protein [Burkholderiaceae bacterium]
MPASHTGAHAATPYVALDDIALRYAGQSILDGIGLTVRRGEVVSVLGPSGAGKSSLLRIIAGLLAPARGSVTIGGEPMRGPRPDVALAFQDPCLLPWLSVERNTAFGLGFARQEKIGAVERRARISAALEEVGLTQARRLAPAQLSGGMAQRVALARCVARRPKVLLLDEPFGALDEATRADMQRLLLQVVADTQAATVFVTHDIDEALRVSDRIVLLGRQGRLVLERSLDMPAPRQARLHQLDALRIDILQALRQAR